MSIRRRINTNIVDIWVTNNSNDVNIIGSLRWAIVQAHNTLPTFIKVAPDFIDLAGVGRNMYVADTWVTNIFGSIVKNITIDFSYINVLIGTGGGFGGGNNILHPTFKLQNLVVENQDLGTPTSALFGGMIDYTNCRFENLVMNATVPYFEYYVTSTNTNCIFRNVVNNQSANRVFSFGNGTYTVDNCIFDRCEKGYASTVSPTYITFFRCYFNLTKSFFKAERSPFVRLEKSFIVNATTNSNVCFFQTNFGDWVNCTLRNVRISEFPYTGEKPLTIRHCTQIYTLPITASTILNPISASLAHTIQNNIFISQNSNNIFPTNLTSLTESENLYLCRNSNVKFPNSTHYGATTPLTTLIDTNEQGVGDTFKRYYLPTITNNVARLADVLQNQIEQNRTNPTNIGAI